MGVPSLIFFRVSFPDRHKFFLPLEITVFSIYSPKSIPGLLPPRDQQALSLRTLALLVIVGSTVWVCSDLRDYSSIVVTSGSFVCKNAYPYRLVLIVLTSRNNAHMLPYMC